MPGKCEHGLTTAECLVCASPKHGERANASECHWSQDGEDSDVWATQCGRLFTIIADTPSDNDMRFCCFCGKPLTEIRFEDEQA